MLNLDQWTATYILEAFRESAKTARTELNRKVHVMEITNAILNRNAPEANVSVSDVKKVLFKAVPGITIYDGEDDIKKLYYLESRGKLLLIGPSFGSVQNAISKISGELQINTLDVGHTAGFGREERNTVLGYRIKQALLAPGTLSHAEADRIFAKYDRALSKVHMDYKVSLSKSSSLASTLVGKFDFIYTVPQDSTLNRNILGSKEAAIGRQFENAVAQLADVKTSPSLLQMLAKQQEQAFLGKKIEQEKYKAVRRGFADFNKGRVKVTKIKPANTKKGRGSLSTIKLQALINLRLHDAIKRQMGTGESKNVLNYRTGRFAKSAEAQAVIQSRQNKLDIYYTYQRNPYDTFLPGGRLYKPRRDPRTIIGTAIRELAAEYVSNNFKVKPILRD